MMTLPREVYESILQDVDLPVLCCLHLGLLGLKYPGVHPDTICAIFAQENQYKVLKSHHVHKAHMDTYCSRYLEGEDLLLLCGEVDFPPCLMMRRMLETLVGLSKQRVSEALKQPALLQGVDAAAALQMWQQRVAAQQQQQEGQPPHRHRHQHKQQPQQQQQVLRHTPVQSNSSSSQSSDPSRASSRWDPQLLIARLQRDVVRCVHADRSYSPYCDMAKSLAGLEYEAFLYQQLEAAGVPFWSEAELRDRGLFKTPDALLQVPICIRDSQSRWHMVHWIDSKASFGDDRTHGQQMDGQYATYVNRYGPGCVIYWFGFIADLAVTSVQQQGQGGGEGQGEEGGLGQQVDVVLRDSFPGHEDIMRLPSAAAHSAAAAAAQDATSAAAAAAATAAAHDHDASGVAGVMPAAVPPAAVASCQC